MSKPSIPNRNSLWTLCANGMLATDPIGLDFRAITSAKEISGFARNHGFIKTEVQAPEPNVFISTWIASRNGCLLSLTVQMTLVVANEKHRFRIHTLVMRNFSKLCGAASLSQVEEKDDDVLPIYSLVENGSN